jgi:hypothetical protein
MTKARVIFAVAAQADDALIWDRLRGIQTEVFAAGQINVKVAYFGREVAPPNRPFISTRWAADADDLQALMDRARARCICGCYVNIDDILAEAVREARNGPVQAVVIIGDNFHGSREEALAHAEQLRAAGTRLFLFRQSSQRAFPDDVFRTLAEMTNGAYYEFNPSIERVAERLPRLFETVIHYAIGGPAALKALSDESADLLLEQLDLLDAHRIGEFCGRRR